MKRIFTAFFMAWGMFWIVPCPLKRWDEGARIGMLLFLPGIGLLIGAVWALCGAGLNVLFPEGKGVLFTAGVMTAIPFVLSGFIHLDGYMDCADAVLSRRDLETRRRILKDSHVGSFAVIALALLFLLEFAVLGEGRLAGRRLWCLPFVCAASRAWSTFAVLYLRPLPGSSYERMFSGGVPAAAKTGAAVILAVLAVLPVWIFGRCGLCAVIGMAGAALTVAYVRRDLGGMSGDVSGAGITVGELCALTALAFL
ncbi:MAG: adenosylcobinamide-GDP ribazoletransferase [Oscillospiraceae bacterium]|nr:adenosylcobinamide-GDP ribazoletransferase [Oscillospiraceae bacterium]